jgi:alcohol dehydrogenase (NADP+)
MIESSDLRMTKIPLNHGAGHMPALGFGTLIPDPAETITATRDALEAGFRHFDCAERYGNEREVGRALQEGLAGGGLGGGMTREDIFVTTKLWNSNHRPERVEPAFEASLDRLGLKYLDLYLIHTPFAFQPGDNQDPRDQNGNVLYDHRRDFARHLESAGNSRGSRQVPGDRTFRHQLKRTEAHL